MSCGHCGIPRNNQIDPDQILGCVSLALERLSKVSDFNGKEGGMFCLIKESTGELMVEPTLIGTINNGKQDKYAKLCVEKANRLRTERAKNSHWLSWQSRDPENEMWGGAFCDGDCIWSFSGLNEHQDEAVVIIAAHLDGRIMNGEPQALAEISDNKIFLDNEYLFWTRTG